MRCGVALGLMLGVLEISALLPATRRRSTSARGARRERPPPAEEDDYGAGPQEDADGAAAPGDAAPRLKRVARGKRPTVAVIGRPNVGKSTLVNRMCDAGTTNGAIVFNEPGVTRDRVYQTTEWCGRTFDLVDTGGLLFEDSAEGPLFIDEIREQAAVALRESCCAIVVVDGKEGRVRVDEEVAEYLRKTWKGTKTDGVQRSIVLAVNKCENARVEAEAVAEFWRLGLGEPFGCSAIHGNGVAEVLDALLPTLDEDAARRSAADAVVDTRPHIDVALLGRPNVGKSSLLNRLLGETDHAIVSEVAGTTRDAIDASLEVDGKVVRFVDTAGVRRKSRVDRKGAEELMVERSLRAVRRCDVALLVLDSSQELTDQDAALAKRIRDDGRACVVIANKWDIFGEKDSTSTVRYSEKIREALPDVARWAEICFVSALTGQRCLKVFAAIERAARAHRRRISTATLNDVVRDAMLWQPPPAARAGKSSAKIYFVSQISHSPPTIVAMCNDPDLFTPNYKRYLERKLREDIGFDGTPIRFVFRGKRLRTSRQDSDSSWKNDAKSKVTRRR